MKFPVFLGLLLLLGGTATTSQASKPWNVDAYADEPFCVFRWIAYIKRLFLIGLTLSAVILYYIPESRSYARKGCYMLVDLLADSLKAILCGPEDENSQRPYAKIKSEYRCWRYGEIPEICAKESYEKNDWATYESRKRPNSKTFVDQDEEELLRRQEKRKRHLKRNKEEERKSEECYRKKYDPSIGDVPGESCLEMSSSSRLCQDGMDDVHKLVRSKFYCASGKKSGHKSVDNYATFLISGTPREMAMIDQKYEKDDIIILQEPCKPKRRRKGHGISATKTTIKEKAEGSEVEGPTRDRDCYVVNHSKNSNTIAKDMDTDSRSAVATMNTILYDSDAGSNGRCRQDDHSSFRSPSPASRFLQDWDVDSIYKSAASNSSPKTYWRKKKFAENQRGGTWKNDGNSRVRFTGEDREDADLDLDERPQRESNLFWKTHEDLAYEEGCRGVPVIKNGPQPALRRAMNWLFGSCPSGAILQEKLSDEVGKEEIRNIARRSAAAGTACRENGVRLDAGTSNGIGRD